MKDSLSKPGNRRLMRSQIDIRRNIQPSCSQEISKQTQKSSMMKEEMSRNLKHLITQQVKILDSKFSEEVKQATLLKSSVELLKRN